MADVIQEKTEPIETLEPEKHEPAKGNDDQVFGMTIDQRIYEEGYRCGINDSIMVVSILLLAFLLLKLMLLSDQ